MHETLKITQIHWSWSPDDVCHLPQWKGSLIRGALGWALVHIAQAAPTPSWPKLQTHSFAEAVFEPQLAWNSQLATPAWSMDCDDTRTFIGPEDPPLSGTMCLFGPWESWAIALLEDCFHHAAHKGLGPQRMSGKLIHWSVSDTPIHQPAISLVGAVTLRTRSPCRLSNKQNENPSLNPTHIAQGLLRRWRSLHKQLLNYDPYSEETGRALYASAEQLESVNQSSHSFNIERASQRQARRHSMPVIHGELTITGPALKNWIALFSLAPVLHIGKQAHFGFGSVDIEWLPNPRAQACKNSSRLSSQLSLQNINAIQNIENLRTTKS